MMTTTYTRSALASAILLAISGQTAMAEEQPQKSANEKVERIVVSGTPAGIGVRKIDAGYAVTNIDADQIVKLSPKSTADLFKAVPGVEV